MLPTQDGVVAYERGLIAYPQEPAAAQQIEARTVDIPRGCLRFPPDRQVAVIDDERELRAQIAASRAEVCRRRAPAIDFGAYTLVGVGFRAFCRYGGVYRYQVLREAGQRRYLINMQRLAPEMLCRGMSFYELWLVVPKLPAGYEIALEVDAIDAVQPER